MIGMTKEFVNMFFSPHFPTGITDLLADVYLCVGVSLFQQLCNFPISKDAPCSYA